MFQHHPDAQCQHLLRGPAVIISAGLMALALGPGPAAARQDAGPTAANGGHAADCFLQRVGTQYVRCDNNTGNGVPAPVWIAER